ncbi:MAG: hypothetical protein QME12_03375 [Nanoarchaeota archaeon]|nr:hypothetical protein [Nanoarchaeota archaeon]
MKFKKEDIGKRVLLELDPEKNPIAKALGAKVYVEGRILELGDDYVKIETLPHFPSPLLHSHIKEIQYDNIKSYSLI